MAMTEEQIERLTERAQDVVNERAKTIVEAAKGKAAVPNEDYAFLLAWLQYRVDFSEGYDEDDYEDYEDEDEDDED